MRKTTPQKGCVQGGLKYHSAVRHAWGRKERMRAVLQEDETGQSKIWRGGNRTIRFLKDIKLPRPPNRNNEESERTCKTTDFKLM